MVKKNEGDLGKKVAWGVGIAAIAAAAAGTYFLYGTKKGAKARKQIKGWAIKAKGEVLEKMEALKEINEEIYGKIVDEVKSKYEALKSIDAKDIADFSKELKGHWREIKKDIDKKMNPKKKKSAKKTKK